MQRKVGSHGQVVKAMDLKWKESWFVISDKIDFKTKSISKDEENYIMIKASIQKEDIALINIYAPDIGTSKYLNGRNQW